MRILLVVAITAALVLSYGYYHAATHGWLHINLMDTSLKPYGENSRNAKIRLLDGNGHALADAASDNKFGVVRLVHPEAGDCSAEESSASSSSAVQEQWQKCSATLSTWLVEWASRIRFADIKFASCDLKRVPVTVHQSREDWWLWCAPAAHRRQAADLFQRVDQRRRSDVCRRHGP
jgi:hypothetical protein